MKNHADMIKKLFFANIADTIALCDARLNPAHYEIERMARNNFADPMDFGEFFPKLLLLYSHEESPVYHDEAILDRAAACLAHFDAMLRENGTLDDLSGGTHSTNRTAEVIARIFPALALLTEKNSALSEAGKATLRRMADTLVDGGFRDSYHRWNICAALAIAHHVLADERYLAYMNVLLAQGVDMSADGEYSERKHETAILCDRAFLLMAHFLSDDRFLEYPRKHLRHVIGLTEPDGTLNNVTAYSWNQTPKFRAAPYYPLYVMMALQDGDEEFAYMADSLEKAYSTSPDDASLDALMLLFTLDPEAASRLAMLPTTAPKKKSDVFMEQSKLVRIDKPEKKMTMTLFCAQHPVFFQMNCGATVIEARYAGSFFGMHSQFRPSEILPTEDGYKLIYDAKAGYRSQLKEKPETSNWRLMDHTKRELINIQQFRVEITVHILDDGVKFDMETFGCERIPTKFELVMTPGHLFESDSIMKRTKAGDYVYLKDGTARYYIGWHSYAEIETDHYYNHVFGEEMRGAVPKDPEKFTVCMTADTPHRSSVTLRIHNL